MHGELQLVYHGSKFDENAKFSNDANKPQT
jgi:hypothetical protein